MGKRLYVGNLSYDTKDDSLIAAFEQDGRKVASVHIVTDRDTGRPRGFAFVEMASEEDAQSAISAMDGTEVDGRALRVGPTPLLPPASMGPAAGTLSLVGDERLR